MNENFLPVANTSYSSSFWLKRKYKEKIFYLKPEYSAKIWMNYIDQRGQNYHDLPTDNWLHSGERDLVGSWIDALNKCDIAPVKAMLLYCLKWKPDDNIVFLVDKNTAFSTSYQMFLDHWDSFLYISNDYPILISDNVDEKVVLFHRNGRIDSVVKG